MVTIARVDTTDRRQVAAFIDMPYRLYANIPQWVPPLRSDIALMLNRRSHPFYEHSTAEFFTASRHNRLVGRIAAMENINYNRYHETHTGQFYLFECEDDAEAAAALFTAVFEWAAARRLDTIIGPKGFSAFDGYGLLQQGYQHRQMMSMTNFNPPYYLPLVEAQGFTKEVDFISHFLTLANFELDPRIVRVADRIRTHGRLRTIRFQTRRDLRRWARRIGAAYNRAFVDNWEYVPFTDREIQFVLDTILLIADPRLIRVIAHEEELVGFAFAFPDMSAALQRANGRLFPFGLFHLLRGRRQARGVAANGIGILPHYQGRGGNALLYVEMADTMHTFGFEYCELTQVAETAVQMRRDLQTIGGVPCKNHRVYRRSL